MSLRRRLLNAAWLLLTGETYETRERKLAALKRVYEELSVAERKVLTEQRRMWN